MFRIQQEEKSNSTDLHNIIKRLRTERAKILNKRRTNPHKVSKATKELKMIERQFDDVEKRTRSAEAEYQTALMKEAEIEE